MEVCYNCSSWNLLITDENITCRECSRIQPEHFCSESVQLENETHMASDFLEEYAERFYLSKIDRDIIENRLDKIKHAKSVFSKQDLVLTLIYIREVETGSSISTQAFSGHVGYLISAKQLSNCLEYLKDKLKLSEIGSCLNWYQLLKPYCEYFAFLRLEEIDCMKIVCEKVRHSSNLSVYSIAALVFALCFSHKKNICFNQILDKVSLLANISRTTLKKNCNKYSIFVQEISMK